MGEAWSHSEGERPNTVTVFEREPGGVLYVRVWDGTAHGGRGGWVKRSLRHRDRKRAERYARQQAEKLAQGDDDLRAGRVTLARLFALYARHRSPQKSTTEQAADARRIEMWARFLGGRKDPHRITRGEWEDFQRLRGLGAIDSRGFAVPEEETPCPDCPEQERCFRCGGTGRIGPRRSVRTRTVEADLRFLLAALRWGESWSVGEGRSLLRQGAAPGYAIPTEKNPQRAVATQDRLERTLAVAADVHPFLPTLLALANGTGRRLSAIRRIRCSDLLADRGPHGALRFRADSDKMGYESTFPLTGELRRVLDRHVRAHSGIGDVPMFPDPSKPSRPVSRHRCDGWLRRAEEAAGLEPLPGKLWHAYRAKFATELLDVPDRVVARLGGWKAPRTLDIYQQPDERALLRALADRKELRETK